MCRLNVGAAHMRIILICEIYSVLNESLFSFLIAFLILARQSYTANVSTLYLSWGRGQLMFTSRSLTLMQTWLLPYKVILHHHLPFSIIITFVTVRWSAKPEGTEGSHFKGDSSVLARGSWSKEFDLIASHFPRCCMTLGGLALPL